MGMSMMSGMTMVTMPDGKKVKKKRSGVLGWFKNAFSLSEEEKAEFKERRRMQAESSAASYEREREAPRFLDGRRIR